MNYLNEDEIDTLNRLVVIFLETAELRAKSRKETRMQFWQDNVAQIISSNGFPLLQGLGSVSHEQMEQRTTDLYLDYDQQRKATEAQEADRIDESELEALANQIKQRKKN